MSTIFTVSVVAVSETDTSKSFSSLFMCSLLVHARNAMISFPIPLCLCVQREPRSGLCGAGGFCHLQQGFALLQRQVHPSPATDVGGV